MKILIIGFVVFLIACKVVQLIFTAKIQNKLVVLRNKVKNAMGNVEVQMQRRFDLVPSLVETVKGAAEHEKCIVDTIAKLGQQYAATHNSAEKIAMNKELTEQLKIVYQKLEDYPSIKTSEHFLRLQSELSEIEEDISFARQFYNDAVTIYNNAIMTFPNNLVANNNGFEEEKLFDAIDGAEKAPKIRLAVKKQSEIVCVKCGANIDEDETTCKYCGTAF